MPGQQQFDVREWGADVVVAAGHKWLLGPWGAGFLYVRRDRAESLVPGSVGYRSVQEPTASEIEYEAGARRFEVGSTSPAPHAGLAEAMDVIDDVGIGTIESRIETLTDRLKEGIDSSRLLSPREFHSGLVTIDVDDPAETDVSPRVASSFATFHIPTGFACPSTRCRPRKRSTPSSTRSRPVERIDTTQRPRFIGTARDTAC